jgi:D-apionolactonase
MASALHEHISAVRPTWWGDDESSASIQQVRSGDWSAALTPHGVEHLRFAGRPVLDRVFPSVRLPDWSTPQLQLHWAARDGGWTWAAELPGGLRLDGGLRTDGDALEFTQHSTAATRLELARLGPALLHPLERAGGTARLDGTRDVRWPAQVQAGLVHDTHALLQVPLDGIELTVDWHDALAETEDQRNWADADYKSYTPPLTAPRPIVLDPTTPALQRVSLRCRRIRGTPATSAPAATGPGRWPAIGFQHSGGPLPGPALDALAALRPAFLHLLVDLRRPDAEQRLHADLDPAVRLDLPVVLTAVVPDGADPAVLQSWCGGRLTTLLVFDAGSSRTSRTLARRTREALPGLRIGGGSRAHLADLLRSPDLPADDLDVLSLGLTGGAHDPDRTALQAGLRSLPAVFAAAAGFGRPLLLGPVGLAPAYDSWRPERPDDPAWGAGSPRQFSVFAAGWYGAVLAAAAAAGIPEVSLSAVIGDRGFLTGTDGRPAPLWHLLHRLAALPAGTGVDVGPSGLLHSAPLDLAIGGPLPGPGRTLTPDGWSDRPPDPGHPLVRITPLREDAR